MKKISLINKTLSVRSIALISSFTLAQFIIAQNIENYDQEPKEPAAKAAKPIPAKPVPDAPAKPVLPAKPVPDAPAKPVLPAKPVPDAPAKPVLPVPVDPAEPLLPTLDGDLPDLKEMPNLLLPEGEALDGIEAALVDPPEATIDMVISRSEGVETTLKGITLIPDTRPNNTVNVLEIPEDLGEKIRFKGFDGKFKTAIPSAVKDEIEQVLQKKFIGKKLKFNGLKRVVADIQAIYVKHDYKLIHVFVPPQSMTDKLVIAVNLGGIMKEVKANKAGTPGVKGDGLKQKWASWYNEPYKMSNIQQRITDDIGVAQDRISPGSGNNARLQPKHFKEIVDNYNKSPWNRLNRNHQHPFLNVVGKLGPKVNENDKTFVVGATQVNLDVYQSRPVKFFMGYDNALTDLVGNDRLYLGGVWYDAFKLNKNHQFSMQLFSSTDFSALGGVAFGYEVPWEKPAFNGNMQTSSFYASYSNSVADIVIGGLPSETKGTSFNLGGRHYIELNPIKDAGPESNRSIIDQTESFFYKTAKPRQDFGIYHEIGLGFDYKSTNNALEFGASTVSDDKAGLFQLVGEYNLRQTDNKGETNLRWHNSIGSLSGNFSAIRTGSDDTYFYSKLQLNREHDLPIGMLAKAKLVGQISSANLLASEQLRFGGFSSVRGYAESAFRGDTGFLASIELFSPVMRPAKYFIKSKEHNDELRLLAFVDFGAGDSSEASTTRDISQTLLSTGVGFRYNYNSTFVLRADYGIPLSELDTPPFPSEASESRFHLGAVWSF